MEETNYRQGYSKSTLASHASRTAESDAAFLFPHLKPGARVLDVGCGPGTITVGLAKHVGPGGSVVGIDLSDHVLDLARAHLAHNPDREGSAEITFQTGNVLSGLPFADGEFDVVYVSQVFLHLPPEDDVRAAQEMRRVLRRGGLLAAREVGDMLWWPACLHLDRKFNRKLIANTGRKEFIGGSMPKLLRTAGFRSEDMRIGAGTTVYSGKDSRETWAAGLAGRLAEGDAFRESWVKTGFSVEDVDETKRLIEQWATTEDAWYAALQSEILAWKLDT
ncbi:hypothetical protein P8C59_005684 [Phyllachora maydis]|uniref:Methyltransferase domain-containing protein n=1 Tax=Phyllachora maydis TaxID=1825666 RepID=A0AAD9I616_9PEZI|nr:hypothetical protein P8C59_005684 [Phyllachora maydis]